MQEYIIVRLELLPPLFQIFFFGSVITVTLKEGYQTITIDLRLYYTLNYE